MLKQTRRTWSSAIFVAACSASCLTACSGEPDVTSSHDETEQLLQGELRRVVVEDPDQGTSHYDYFLELSDARWLPLELDHAPDFEPNLLTRVRGKQVGAVFHVTDIELSPSAQEPGTLQEPLIAATPKRVAVVLFNFSNDTSAPIDAARAKELVFTGTSSSNAYFKEASFGVRSLVGALDASGDVFGWYTIDQTNAGCSYSAWGTAAHAKATAAGVNLNNYDHIVYYFPRASSCQFAGVAQVPGKLSWINGSDAQTISHELGHNFGVSHASSHSCQSGGVPVAIGGTCTSSEYGDPFDVMGRGYRHFSAYHKEKLGFLEAPNIQTVTASGSFDIAPLAQKAAGLQVLRYPIPGTSEVYYVEYRQPFGFDNFKTTDPVANGVLIRRITLSTRASQTKLLDNVPGTTSFTDAALLVGKTFTDSAAKVSFSLTARSASAATVQVTLNGVAPTDPTDPTGPTDPTDPTDPVPGCGAGETEHASHCYFATTSAQTHTEAANTCSARGPGWKLVSIESAVENGMVSSLVGGIEHWLGANDTAKEGTFVWSSGSTFWTGGLYGWRFAGAYANFVWGEPNNTGDCVRMVAGGQWRDVSCEARYRAVCEK